MKFYVALLLLTVGQVSGFSAVAPPKTSASVASGSQPIDRTMKGIDADNAFDPTEGESSAVKRNNNDEVWVQQVGLYLLGACVSEITSIGSHQLDLTVFLYSARQQHSVLVLVGTGSRQLSVVWYEKTLSHRQTLFNRCSFTTKTSTKTLHPCRVVSVIP
jgi:hypothetical protein